MTGLTLAALLTRLWGGTDILGMTALVTSGELSKISLIAGLVFFATSAFGARWLTAHKRAVPMPVQVSAYVFLIAAALYLIFAKSAHPIEAAAQFAPFIHGILFFSGDGLRSRGFRLGFCFFEVVIAAALSPTLVTAAVIFLFAGTALFTLSFSFLQWVFSRQAPEFIHRPVPRRFVTLVSAVSFVTFAASLIIFPTLPRLKSATALDLFPQVAPGYTENIELGAGGGWSTGGGQEVVRVLLPDSMRETRYVAQIFGTRLLRARALEKFNGVRWDVVPGQGHRNRMMPRGDHSQKTQNSDEVLVVREALGATSLPVPYNAESVRLSEGGVVAAGLFVRATGDWGLLGSSHRQVRYWVKLSSQEQSLREVPEKIHLELPALWKQHAEPWRQLQEKLFTKEMSPLEKIMRMKLFLQSGEYTGELSDLGETAKTEQQIYDRLTNFMFETKTGHCGYYASSTAILLRMSGVPTRVVSGFLMPAKTSGGMVTVRSRDAHAWVEAYDPENGWVAIDVTPPVKFQAFLPFQAALLEFMAEVENVTSAFWYRYVLNFDQKAAVEAAGAALTQAPKAAVKSWLATGSLKFERWDFVAVTAVVLTLVGLLVAVVRYKWLQWYQERMGLGGFAVVVPYDLVKRRRRLRSLLKKVNRAQFAVSPEHSDFNAILNETTALDERIRFGRPPTSEIRRELLENYDDFLELLDSRWQRLSKSENAAKSGS